MSVVVDTSCGSRRLKIIFASLETLDPDFERADDGGSSDENSAEQAMFFVYDGAHLIPDESELPGITAFREARARELAGRHHWYACGAAYARRPAGQNVPRVRTYNRSDVAGRNRKQPGDNSKGSEASRRGQ